MTDTSSATGHAEDTASVQCPACTHETPVGADARCVHCGAALDATDVTSDDRTPYALSLQDPDAAPAGMRGWIIGASRVRLAHLALCRRSRASRRFAVWQALLLSIAVGVAVLLLVGWRMELTGPGTQGQHHPQGRGWWQVHRATLTAAMQVSAKQQPVALWWNPPLATVTAALALVAAFILGLLWVWLVGRAGPHVPGMNSPEAQCMRCAVQYSTAWGLILSIACLLAVVVPAGFLARVVGWTTRDYRAILMTPAIVVAAAGVLGWWFWLIRLSQTVPRSMRSVASRLVYIRVPLVTAILAAGGWLVVREAADRVAEALRLTW